MILCVIENEKTARRELYVDGVLSGFVTKEMMDFAVPGWGKHVDFWLAHPEKWTAGRIMGDPEALPEDLRQ